VTALRAECARLAATVQGLIDRDKLTGDYIVWLKERSAARAAKK
jgi:hypothetical protein